MAMLSIRNLTKRYGDKTAVDDLTMEVKRGELCAFIGHNGAGKTTTLKCVAGILGFDAGHIRVTAYRLKRTPWRSSAASPTSPTIPTYTTL